MHDKPVLDALKILPAKSYGTSILSYLLLISILITSFPAEANFWDVLWGCITHPCNCGGGERIEQWNGTTYDRGLENNICPPWNKEGGRDDHTCIVQYDYPGIFSPWYLQYCAEETPESTYFDPKIRLRAQECNSFACWPLTKTLNWDGECAVWPTPWGLPLLRICARIAVPADPNKGLPADPGYTFRQHLNWEGALVADIPSIGVDNQPIYNDGPKLCAYRDPSMLDVISVGGINVDLMDWNPTRQILHKTKELHPIAKVILTFVNFVTQTGQSLLQMIGTLLDMLGGVVIPGLDIFKPIFEFLGTIIQLFGDVIAAIIKEFGQLNRVVDDYKFGCVNIPIGPMPPPFCPKIQSFVPMASVQSVCPLGTNGMPVTSSEDTPCVVSKLVNNSIRNTIRLGFDIFVPLCANNEDPTQTDKCVTLTSSGPFESASTMHAVSARRDNIQKCPSSGAPCVNTKINFVCDVSQNGCEDGFRVVYGTEAGSKLSASNYFYDFVDSKNTIAMVDCSGSQSVNCQKIWGINTGQYIDITLTFPQIQNPGDLSPLTQTFSLNDSNGTSRSFTAVIVRTSTFNTNASFTQSPNQICVFENGTDLVGCVDRISAPKPKIYGCSSGISGISCNNTYFEPALIASIEDGTDYTRGAVQALSVQNASSQNYQINLAGYDFTSFVTDQTLITMPFTGSHSINASTLYGNYVDNQAPYDSKGNSTNAVYLSGLEYINNQYIQGGSYVCLQTSNTTDKCPMNPILCVLSNLLNSNIVDCQAFSNKVGTYPGLQLCSSSIDMGTCTQKDSIAGKSGGSGITIYQCGTAGYCYTNSSNVEVCKSSLSPVDRYIPSSSLGNTLSDSQYFNLNDASGPGYTYDKSLYSLRDKTALELNLCTTIPQPSCSATTEANVAWPAAQVGQTVTGTCVTGTTPSSAQALQRTCASDANSRSVSFTPLPNGVSCQ
jgi:hypothetical protein